MADADPAAAAVVADPAAAAAVADPAAVSATISNPVLPPDASAAASGEAPVAAPDASAQAPQDVNQEAAANSDDKSDEVVVDAKPVDKDVKILIPPYLPPSTVLDIWKLIPRDYFVDKDGNYGKDYIVLQSYEGLFTQCKDGVVSLVQADAFDPSFLWAVELVQDNIVAFKSIDNKYYAAVNGQFTCSDDAITDNNKFAISYLQDSLDTSNVPYQMLIQNINKEYLGEKKGADAKMALNLDVVLYNAPHQLWLPPYIPGKAIFNDGAFLFDKTEQLVAKAPAVDEQAVVAPAPSDAQPAASGAQPAASDAQPAASDAQPAASDAQPAASVAQPAASDAQPAASAAQPAASDAQPAAQP